jgi:hypothetical protein
MKKLRQYDLFFRLLIIKIEKVQENIEGLLVSLMKMENGDGRMYQFNKYLYLVISQ